MPWNEVKPMDEKVKFIADYLRKDMPFKALCALYGISRKTSHRVIKTSKFQFLSARLNGEQKR